MLAPLLSLALLAAPPPVRCVALAPHFEGEATAAELAQNLNEIKDLGANLVMVVVQWAQVDVTSDTLGPYEWGTDDAKVRAVIAHARAVGLDVLVFPIVKLARIEPGQWRGTLSPRDRGRWWAAYERFILHYARLGAEAGAGWLSVGSELGTLEADEPRWRQLIAAVRGVFRGQLIYSANWDHFQHVGFWDALDAVGLNAYHPITSRDGATTLDLTRAWRGIRRWLLAWHAWIPRPLLFTEMGYPSVEGGARRPYHYGAETPPDMGEQARAYAAFIDTWRDQPGVAGACVWIWTGRGGFEDKGYMPRGKPAEALLRAWFRE
ncbi:MAG: hypothetical protein KC549_13175 [Myxococcales bacterium]|nr:hypothetical protein [Myxococcales bacterium]